MKHGIFPPSGTFFPSHLKLTEITNIIIMVFTLFSLHAYIQGVFNRLLESQVDLKITQVYLIQLLQLRRSVELFRPPKSRLALN